MILYFWSTVFHGCSTSEDFKLDTAVSSAADSAAEQTDTQQIWTEPCSEHLPSIQKNMGSSPAWGEPIFTSVALYNPCATQIILLGMPTEWLSEPFFLPTLPPISLAPQEETTFEIGFSPQNPASIEQSFSINSSHQPFEITLSAQTTDPLTLVVQSGQYAASTTNYAHSFSEVVSNTAQSPPRRDLCYGNERFIAVGGTGSGHYWSSNNGYSWAHESINTEPLIACVYGENFFVAISESLPYHSIAGHQWNEGAGTPWMHAPLHDISYGAGRFIAVGNGGRIAQTDNGNAWGRDESFSSFNLFQITYGDGVFIAAGSFGGVLRSADQGQTWDEQVVGEYDIRQLIHTHRGFLLSNGSELYHSEDGSIWEILLESDIKILNAIGDRVFGSRGSALFELNLSVPSPTWQEVHVFGQNQPISRAHLARVEP